MAQPEQMWLDQARARALRGDLDGASSLIAAALAEHPRSFELRRMRAGIFQQTGNPDLAEPLLRELLLEQPNDFATAFTLARLLVAQARGRSAAQSLRDCFEHGLHHPELAIRAIEFVDEADRKSDAAAIADIALAAAPKDARLHAYAGMLQLQLGNFERARKHYEFALQHSPDACEWEAPLGLANAQRYADASHRDFALFRTLLQREDLSRRARSTLLFALGKSHDDIGDYAQAAEYFRQANALAHSMTLWTRKAWRRAVEARLAAPPIGHHVPGSEDFAPIFIVGMPRSGTTLLAELLARRPKVCNRGELPWIGKLALLPELASAPERTALERGAAIYRAQAKQDDQTDARWYMDKQPLNFRYVDLMLAMFPNAKIIACRRSARDTALSLWMQSFKEEVQGYSYDFNAILAVMRDCERLMEHWRSRFPEVILPVQYEQLVAHPDAVIAKVAAWIGLPAPTSSEMRAAGDPASVISTASLWQARQPVHSKSVNRWEHYATHLPQLLSFPAI